MALDGIAKHIGISKEAAYPLVREGKDPAHRIGKLWKFKTSEVDKVITSGGADETVTMRKKVTLRKRR